MVMIMETAMEIVQTTLQETTMETIIKTQQVSGDNIDLPISLFFVDTPNLNVQVLYRNCDMQSSKDS